MAASPAQLRAAKREVEQAEASEERMSRLYDAGQANQFQLRKAIDRTMDALAYYARIGGDTSGRLTDDR